MQELLRALGVGAVYLLLGVAALRVSSFDGVISVFWLPAGWAVFSVWRYGRSSVLGVALAQTAIGLGFGGEGYPLLTTVLFVAGNSLGYGLLAWRLHRHPLGDAFVQTRTMVRLLLLVFGCHAINATFGVLGLVLGQGVPWAAAPDIAWNWWGGDVGGALALAPLLLSQAQRSTAAYGQAGIGGAAAGLLVVLMVDALLFLWAGAAIPRTLIFLVLPPLLWLAYQADARAACLGLMLTILVAAAATVRDAGLLGSGDAASALLQLQIFTIVLALTLLMVLATNQERRALLAAMGAQTLALEDQVQSRTQEITRSNARLRQLGEERSAMLGIVAHDLKNPLTAASGAVSLLRSTGGALSVAQRDELLGNADRALQRMFELVSSLLDVERVDHGLKPVITRFDLRDLAEQCVDDFRPAADRKRIDLACEGSAQPAVDNDRQLLREVLDNLVSNAVKYARPGDRVRVRIESGGTLQVVDTGPGIPADELPRLFDKFARLSPQPSAGENSTGLGLHLTKTLVDRLGCRLEVDSSVGVGTRFSLHVGQPGAAPPSIPA